MSLLFLYLASLLAPRPHPGPPVFVEIRADSAEVKISITAEQASILGWMGLRFPLPDPAFDPQIEERLGVAVTALLEERRGLDLSLDARAVTYEVARVEPLEMFGAGNAEPALRIDLSAITLDQSPPNRIDLTWGLFGLVEDPAERTLPVLVEADGEFDLLRATEIRPTVRWTRSAADDDDVPAGLEAELPAPSIPVTLAAPRLGAADRSRSIFLAGFLLAGAGLVAALRAHRGRGRRLVAVGLALALGLGWLVSRQPQDPERLDAQGALRIFDSLHRNVYRAFDERSESEIYDRLASCVHGPLLDDLYTQILQGLVLEEDGGALCRIESLSHEAGSLISPDQVTTGGDSLPEDGFAVEWTWRVRGRVVHFGHEHERENHYRARYGVRPIDGSWRITSFEPLAQVRGEGAL